MPDNGQNIVALRPLDCELCCRDAIDQMTGPMMAAVFQVTGEIDQSLRATGLPSQRRLRVTVDLTEKLAELLHAGEAFDIRVEWLD
jgi:hypothetical protein